MWWFGMPASGAFPYGGWWAWHMVAVTLFWVFLVTLAIIAARRISRPGREKEYSARDGGILSAMTILQERYARGEIGREEFMQMQNDLVATPCRDETVTNV